MSKFLLTASEIKVWSLEVEADTKEQAVELGWNTEKDNWTYETNQSDEWYVSSVTLIN